MTVIFTVSPPNKPVESREFQHLFDRLTHRQGLYLEDFTTGLWPEDRDLKAQSIAVGPEHSLSCHRHVHPFLRTDDVVVGILAQVDLHPVNLSIKDAGIAVVV